MSKQRVAAVLGVGPGLGSAAARRFAREGFAVALLARGQDKLDHAKAQLDKLGGTSLTVATDAADPASVRAAFATIGRELGPPEVLIYNAGAYQMGGILEVTPEQFAACWQANCMGGFLAAQQVLPAMLERGGGTLLFSGATASLRGSARFSCLAVGKFGLRALAQSLAREFGPRGIHVAHIIIDGQIDTPRLRAAVPDRDPATLLSPDAIAETYWQLYQQDRSAWTQELDLRPATEKF